MKKITAALFLTIIFTLFCIFDIEAVWGRFWKQDKYMDFTEGTPSHTAVLSDGKITLAPTYKSIYKLTDREYIWSSAVDSAGNLILATGSKAAIYKISPAGKEIWKQALEGLEATAVTIDKSNNIYAAVSPDGAIYRLTSDGKASEYFKTEQKYVWALATDKKGNLYAATGSKGQLFKITGKDEGSIFAKLPDTHITALFIDQNDEIYGGTDSNGYVFKVDGTGKVFILYDADEREIKSIISDDKGNLYAAAVRQSGIIAEKKPAKETKAADQEKDEESQPAVSITVAAATKGTAALRAPSTEQKEEKITAPKSTLYLIDKDNRVEKVLQTSKTTIFSLTRFQNSIYVGGGEKGRLYSYTNPEKIALIMEIDAKHITAMSSYQSRIFICSSNEAEVYLLENGYPEEGVFFSKVFDADAISRFGTIKWFESLPPETNIRLFTRSGNTETPDETWSSWSSPCLSSEGSKIESPAARFIQWKAVLKTADKSKTPVLDMVNISYLPLNVSPNLSDIKLHPKGLAMKERAEVGETDPRLEQLLEESANGDDSDNGPLAPIKKDSVSQSGAKKYYQEGALTISWDAKDPNEDTLSFTLHYKGEKEKEWKLLAEDLTRTFYTWDTKAVSDGLYRIKIIASDNISTPENLALKTELLSEIILIDNSAPVLSQPVTEVKSGIVKIVFSARDNLSAVVKCQYSINGGKWKPLFPDDGIGDTLKEDYTISLKPEKKGEYTVVIQVTDSEGNMSAITAAFDF